MSKKDGTILLAGIDETKAEINKLLSKQFNGDPLVLNLSTGDINTLASSIDWITSAMVFKILEIEKEDLKDLIASIYHKDVDTWEEEQFSYIDTVENCINKYRKRLQFHM